MPEKSYITLIYRVLRSYVDWFFKHYYSEYIVVGRENIPENTPLIFAPNHRNALIDALAVLTVTSKTQSTTFLARSDIFRNKTAAKFLRFAKMLPAFRIRDGVENLGRNADTFDQCKDLLINKQAICIMPEGNQELDKKIRPLVKGIFRIAFSTQIELKNETVNIIPVGIDYGCITKGRKHIIINIGKPIKVTDFIESYKNNEAVAINELRAELSKELSSLTIDIASKENYTAFETAINIAEKSYLEQTKTKITTISKYLAHKQLSITLLDLEKNKPEKVNKIIDKTTAYIKNMRLLGFEKTKNLGDLPNFVKLALKSLLFILTFPLFLSGFILNFLAFLSPILIRKYVFKPKFSGFYISIEFVLNLFTFPIFYLIQILIISSFIALPFWVLILSIPIQLLLGKIALFWFREGKKFLTQIKIFVLSIKKPKLISEIMQLKTEIIELIIK